MTESGPIMRASLVSAVYVLLFVDPSFVIVLQRPLACEGEAKYRFFSLRALARERSGVGLNYATKST